MESKIRFEIFLRRPKRRIRIQSGSFLETQISSLWKLCFKVEGISKSVQEYTPNRNRNYSKISTEGLKNRWNPTVKIFVTLTAKRIFFASGEEEFRPEQRQNILSHSLPSNQSWTGVCMITHDTATKTVVALARETFAFEEAGVTGTLVGHVLALGVDALGE